MAAYGKGMLLLVWLNDLLCDFMRIGLLSALYFITFNNYTCLNSCSLFVINIRFSLSAALVKFKAYYHNSGLLSASTQYELPVIGSSTSFTSDWPSHPFGYVNFNGALTTFSAIGLNPTLE